MKEKVISDNTAQRVADDRDSAAVQQEMGVVLHECTVLLVQLELEAIQDLHKTECNVYRFLQGGTKFLLVVDIPQA